MDHELKLLLLSDVLLLFLTWSHRAICRSFQREVPDVRSIFMLPRISTLLALCVLELASCKQATQHMLKYTSRMLYVIYSISLPFLSNINDHLLTAASKPLSTLQHCDVMFFIYECVWQTREVRTDWCKVLKSLAGDPEVWAAMLWARPGQRCQFWLCGAGWVPERLGWGREKEQWAPTHAMLAVHYDTLQLGLRVLRFFRFFNEKASR